MTLGTDSKLSAMGKGRVNILTKKGEKKYIWDVYFVLGLKHNLISIGQLMQKGYNVFFKNDVCTILDMPLSKQFIAKVQMTKNRMFFPKDNNIFERRRCTRTTINELTIGWKKRCNCHTSELWSRGQRWKLVMAFDIWTSQLWRFENFKRFEFVA